MVGSCEVAYEAGPYVGKEGGRLVMVCASSVVPWFCSIPENQGNQYNYRKTFISGRPDPKYNEFTGLPTFVVTITSSAEV